DGGVRVWGGGCGGGVGVWMDGGSRLMGGAWSHSPGDQRLAFTGEGGPFERPAIWDPTTGERRDIEVDLPGAGFPLAWWPDASSLLVRHEHEARAQLYRLDPASGAIEPVVDPQADIDEAGGTA